MVISRSQLIRRAQSHMFARKTAKLSASLSNFASRGAMALLYSLVAIAPVMGSSKFRMACERPRPKAKAGGAGAAGAAGRGGSGAGSTGGAAAVAGWAGGAAC